MAKKSGSGIRVKCKIWLEKDGQPLIGEGRFSLLKEIARTGSINEACTNLDISYRHAWGQIKKLEDRLGEKLVETRVGGVSGGGAKLTDQAEKLIGKYDELKTWVENRTELGF